MSYERGWSLGFYYYYYSLLLLSRVLVLTLRMVV